MKKTDEVKLMCEYLVSWIERKEYSMMPESKRLDEITEGHRFGHDWNAMFPQELKGISNTIKNTLYCAMCIVIRDRQFVIQPEDMYRKKSRNHNIDRLVMMLNDDEITSMHNILQPHQSKDFRSAFFIIYYQLKELQELTSKK